MSAPPEMAPGEVSRVESTGIRLDVVKDVLGQLDPPGVDRLLREPEAFSIMMPVSEALALRGNEAILLGFDRVSVGAGDLNLETLF